MQLHNSLQHSSKNTTATVQVDKKKRLCSLALLEITGKLSHLCYIHISLSLKEFLVCVIKNYREPLWASWKFDMLHIL